MKRKKNYFKRGFGLVFSLLIGGMAGLAADTALRFQDSAHFSQALSENDQPTAGMVVKEMYDKELDVHQYVLSNNIRLNLKSMPVRRYNDSRIAVRASFGRGELETPNQQAALPFVTDIFLMKGGVQAGTGLTKKAISLNFSVDLDDFSLSGSTNQNNLRDFLMRMCAYFTAPVYRVEVMSDVHTTLEEVYHSLHKTPQGVCKDKVARLLASNDWKFGYPPKNETMAIIFDQICSFVEKPLKKSYLELSIVGDFNVEYCLQMVLQTVGLLPKRENNRPYLEELRQVKFPKTPFKETFLLQDEKYPTAFVMVIWPTADGWNCDQTRCLRVLSEIFTQRLKWQMSGITGPYVPLAKNEASLFYPEYGQFSVYSHANPTQADLVQKNFLDTALHIRSEITDREFERAIKIVLDDLDSQEDQLTYWMNVIDCSQELPIFLHWAKSLKKTYMHMTKADVQAVAIEFLHPQKAAIIQILPKASS